MAGSASIVAQTPSEMASPIACSVLSTGASDAPHARCGPFMRPGDILVARILTLPMSAGHAWISTKILDVGVGHI